MRFLSSKSGSLLLFHSLAADADFSTEKNWRDFQSWIQESYNPGIRPLIRYWVQEMKNQGRVLRWYPFIDPIHLVREKKSLIRYGCGHASYRIMTQEALTPCPLIGIKEHYIGHIATTHPRDTSRQMQSAANVSDVNPRFLR